MVDRQPSLLVRYGNFLFKYRNGIFPLILIPLLLLLKPKQPFNNIVWGEWLNLAGLAIALLGQAIRVAVVGLAYIVRGGHDHKVHADDLVTGGIFSHCRNPLYVGNLLILLGLFVIHNNMWVYVLGIPFFLTAYISIVAAEEHFLADKFGVDYQRYCDKTNRWFPRLDGLTSTFKSMGFRWKRVVAKEYSSFSYWILAAILIMSEEYLYNIANMDSAFWVSFLSFVFIVNLAIFFIARKYKKSGRLSD